MAFTFGATADGVAQEIRAFGDLSAWAADIARWMSDAGGHVAVALVRVGYDPAEVDARAATDDLKIKCARCVTLRAAADLAQSYLPDNDTIGIRLFAKAGDLEKQIVDLPRAVSPETFDETTQARSTHSTKPRNTAPRFWHPYRKI